MISLEEELLIGREIQVHLAADQEVIDQVDQDDGKALELID